MTLGRFLASVRDPERLPRLLLALGAFGYVLRVAVWLVSHGSNDIRTWYYFALTIQRFGLADTHVLQPLFNHPPLMGFMSLGALHLAEATSVNFALIFKIPSLVAELVTGLLLYRVCRERGSYLLGCGAFAAYGMSLSCIVISGYHGNTDAIYFCLAFLAATLMEKGSPFWSGVALGASLNIKLIPVLLGLPLASRCRRVRDFIHFGFGCSLGAIPFLWAYGVFSDEVRQAFIRNLFMYRSNLEYWGVELAVRWTVTWTRYWLPGVADAAREFGNWYSVAGGKLLILGSGAIALAQFLLSRKLGPGRSFFNAFELTALAFGMFLLFGSGFGVQYVGCIVAPLVACGIYRSLFVSTATGAFITLVYLTFVTIWFPVFSDHNPIPPRWSPWSNLAWFSIAYAVYLTIRDARTRATVAVGATPTAEVPSQPDADDPAALDPGPGSSGTQSPSADAR
jgi:hypothetical protein